MARGSFCAGKGDVVVGSIIFVELRIRPLPVGGDKPPLQSALRGAVAPRAHVASALDPAILYSGVGNFNEHNYLNLEMDNMIYSDCFRHNR